LIFENKEEIEMKFTKKQFERRLYQEVGFYRENEREDNKNFLLWFLNNYFRLDEDHAFELICDKKNDKGIDGIYVDTDTGEIFIFQSKFHEKFSNQQGSSDLNKFFGTKVWFTKENIEGLNDTIACRELKDLVKRQDVLGCLERGFSVKLVFVCTGNFNRDAKEYITASRKEIEYWDCNKLFNNFTFSGKDDFVKGEFGFKYDENPIEYIVNDGMSAFILPVKAVDILKLDGIVDRTLFNKNVRFGLGRTRVNKDIQKTVMDASQHANFLLYHNGITLIAEEVAHNETDKKLMVKNYSIVNGCQSTLTLHENKESITENLKIMLKIIKTGENAKFGEKITYYTNNQNSIDLRDLRSRDKFQLDLQKRFIEQFNGKILYKTKSGEDTSGYDHVIENTFAAQLIYSFIIERPDDAHLKTKVFSTYYNEIFTRRTDVFLINFLDILYGLVESNIENVKEKIVRTYKLTRYFILYCIKKIMNDDEIGNTFFEDYEKFIDHFNDSYMEAFSKLIQIIIIELNGYIEYEKNEAKKKDESVEFKNLLRNSEEVRKMANAITLAYKRLLVHHPEQRLGATLENNEK
jgi:hypothetical protein